MCKNFKYYLKVIKPGIVFGNIISSLSCFLFASKGIIDFLLLFHVLFGLFLIISGSCVVNNIIDIKIDKVMKRTKNRVLVKKNISILNAAIYSFILLFAGFFIIFYYINFFTFFLSFLGFFIYVFLYSLYMKKKSVYAIFVGGISGSIPPLIGYYSVTKKMDLAFLILFFIFFLWQIPHFYSISIFRIKDYKIAKVPILPIKTSILFTKIKITLYILFFIIFSESLYFLGYVGIKYLFFSFLINLIWFIFSILSYFLNNIKIFYYIFMLSILVIFFINFFLSFDYTI
ncbi:heme o synthase [Buchnera aphidicola (Ceratoglyphina bambusae)]|uniref:heme o synthase n=1 Tax=Buchnera aphidicola TaxID=9 RepID=UPI0031B80C1F